jgi:hypothetical protein
LIGKISIDGEKNVEVAGCESHQLAVRYSRPAHLRDGANFMFRELARESAVYAFV